MKKLITLALLMAITLQLSAATYGGGSGSNAKPPRIESINYKMQRSYPGILHNMADIESMRKVVREADPQSKMYQAYENLRKMSFASADYKPQILTSSRRSSTTNTLSRTDEGYIANWQNDIYAMALNALMFAITQKQAHADKAAELLNLYADRVTCAYTGDGAPLVVGINMINYIYAVDMIQSLAPETFKEGEYKKICQWLVDVSIGVEIEKIFLNKPAYTNGNWGAMAMMSYMGLAVLLEDDVRYAKAIDQYLYSAIFEDNGNILHYVDDNGQNQEAGRDAAHAQLGLYGLSVTAEIAWKAGTDLYSAYDNRLMKGFEYLTKFNLGYDDVPYKMWRDVTVERKYSRWREISQDKRGNWRDIYELPFNHYVNRMGFEMPYTKMVLERFTPFKYSDPKSRTSDATTILPEIEVRQDDHFGFGSLLFLNDAK
ncbi:MAG: alginate lyase family protein [Rikenellaceae bacterium]